MNRLILFFIALIIFPGSSFSAEKISLLKFSAPNQVQLSIIKNVLGEEFVKGEGVFPPQLRVAQIDVNGDKQLDLVVLQKAFCSNHSCTYHFVLQTSKTEARSLGDIDSWAPPFVVCGREKMCEIVVFDHITDDCLACSPPQPVLYIWESGGQSDVDYGEFVYKGPVSKKMAHLFKPVLK